MLYTTDDLRKKWLSFWQSKEHTIIPSASILPDNDPTALFHNSGMHPLVPYLMGESHPEGRRLTNAQKCIRTIDIDEVGDATHLTFFEMLGNWSLGDFFKEEQIQWSYEFLFEVLQLPKERIAVSVFAGDDAAPRDEEAANTWEKCGIAPGRIAYLGKDDNWWAKGDTGPCGPDTEMFYWTGEDPAPTSFQETHDDERWVEIWNDVFMQFDRQENGALVALPQKNIDTGMGLERTVAVLNGLKSVYQTDAFQPLLQKLSQLAKKDFHSDPIAQTDEQYSARIIVDHLRTSCIMLADGVTPSNVDQGYILRRIMRRAIRHGRKIGVHANLCTTLAEAVIQKLGTAYPELQQKKSFILEELEREENLFAQTLKQGEKQFQKILSTSPDTIDGETAFDLFQTYGFPLEITQELASEAGLSVNEAGFAAAQKAHQDKSRAGAEQKFAGGLAEQSDATKKLHTATHLLHAALRKVLGTHVEQRGSNITAERLRFDFSHDEKMTPEQKAEVERLVNEAIAADVPITCEETTVAIAKEAGAIGLFEDKYGDKVKMYTMGNFSKEICGGPHANHTGELGHFRIKKEEASSRGVRRIKAVLE